MHQQPFSEPRTIFPYPTARLVCGAAALTFALSLIINLLTFQRSASVQVSNSIAALSAGPLMMAILIVIVLGIDSESSHRKPEFWRLPRPYLDIVMLLLVYTAVLFLSTAMTGEPRASGGGYGLYDHGTLLRSLTEAEYCQELLKKARFFSAFAMLLSAPSLGLAYWQVLPAAKEPSAACPPADSERRGGYRIRRRS